MVDSDSSDEMLDYLSFEGNSCISLFFCLKTSYSIWLNLKLH